MKARGKRKEITEGIVKHESVFKEVLTTAEFTYWLSIYRAKGYELHYTSLNRLVP